MTKSEAMFFIAVFCAALGLCAVAWAITQDQIWNSVYDSSTQSIKAVAL